MSNNVKISVILPSLNVREYIEECILSVINQTLEEIEIICIDSGSTDGTFDVIKKYANQDSRIILLTSDEKSYGHQVNMGIEKAKGEYISIIETDDFIDKNMLESLYNLSDNGNVDLVKSTFYHYNDSDKNNIVVKVDDSKKDLPTSEKFILKGNSLFIEGHPSVWAGIYNKHFLDENKIRMVEAHGGGWVDNPFFFETAIAAKSIVYTNEPYYYYRVSNPNSSSNNFNDFTMPMNRVLDIFNIFDKYQVNDENIIIRFYNRLFRYIEIILENNDNTDKNLDYETCLKIHEVVRKVDEDIVKEKLKFNFKKMYYKYKSPLFLARFKKSGKLSDDDYDMLFKENDFLHESVDYFRTQFNETNYQNLQLEKKINEQDKLLNIQHISLSKKRKKDKKIAKSQKNISKIKNKSKGIFEYEHESEYSISVIMPVFNGAKFLERSMKSLLKQTLNNFEIIFINDGSTDDSLDILRDYEAKFDFVKVLTQENLGSGKARNYGINEAKGEYIAFLDADDFFIDEDALEKMYELAKLNNAKMVTANIKHDLDNKGDFVPFGQFHYYTQNDVILPEQYGIPWSFYKNIFKREFLVENNIYFPDLLRGQDPVFLAEVLTKVDKIYVASTDLYAYVYNSDATKASNSCKLYDQLLHYRQVIDYFDIPKFSRRRSEYLVKIMLFCGRLNDDNIVYVIESIRDIFKDMPFFLRRLENYIYLKFSYLPEVCELISWPKVSVIMEIENTPKLFEETFNSLINQTMDDFELILIDGLGDGSFEIIEYLLQNESWVKFVESDSESRGKLRKRALNEAKGDYIYLCNDSYMFNNNFFENMLETMLINGSEICLCNLPAGGAKKNNRLDIRKIMGNHDYLYYSSGSEKIVPYMFSSSFEPGFVLYKKSLLDTVLSNDDFINDNSVVMIKSILTADNMTFVDKYLFSYLTKNNIFYSSKFINNEDDVKNVFGICNEIEEFLKEKELYDDLKTYFDIYKINRFTSFLDNVRFIGCYSYNAPENRDLYANNDIVLDYSQYYGSKSPYVGLNYNYANEYFNKVKEEFNNLNYRDLKFFELNSNRFSDSNNLNKYNAILKSDSYDEYMEMVNFSREEELRVRNIELKEQIEGLQSRKKQQIKKYEKKVNENKVLEDDLNNELNQLKNENKLLTDKNNQLREQYWENREEYDYILSSKSWKYTKHFRRE